MRPTLHISTFIFWYLDMLNNMKPFSPDYPKVLDHMTFVCCHVTLKKKLQVYWATLTGRPTKTTATNKRALKTGTQKNHQQTQQVSQSPTWDLKPHQQAESESWVRFCVLCYIKSRFCKLWSEWIAACPILLVGLHVEACIFKLKIIWSSIRLT